MNRNLKILCIVVATTIFLSSCDQITKMQVPQTVSVKTKAEYSAPLGTASMSLSDYLSADTLNNVLGSSDITAYDYQPDSTTTQEFLIDYPLEEIPIDISSYFSDMDFTTDLSDMSFSKDIEIPDLSVSDFSSSISVSEMTDSIKDLISFGTLDSVTLLEPGSGNELSTSEIETATGSELSMDFTISSPTFDTVTYSAGSLDLTFTSSSTPSSDYAADVTVSLLHDTTVLSTSDETDIGQGGTIEIPLSGVTLYPDMTISIEVTASGGEDPTVTTSGVSYKENTYDLAAVMSDTEFSSVTGLTVDDADLSVSQSIDMSSASDSFVEATISTGSLSLQAALPDGWSGVTLTPSSMTLGGGLDGATLSDDSSVTDAAFAQTSDLSGATLTPDDITVTGTITVSMSDATLVFAEDADTTIDLTGSVSIDELSSATVDLGSDNDFDVSYSSALPTAVSEYISEMDFSEVGIDVSYVNTLPEGNDIDMTVSSDFFGIGDTTKTIAAATSSATDLSFTTKGSTVDISSNSTVDFNAAMSLPGATTANPSYVTLTDISFGETYTISADVSVVMDWSSVTLNADTSALSQSGTISTGVSLDSIFSSSSMPTALQDIFDNVDLTELPIYLVLEKPDLDALNDFSVTGTVLIQTNDSGTIANQTYLAGSSSGSADIGFVDALSMEENDDGVVTTTLSEDNTSANADLTDIVNARPSGDLEVSYDISMGDSSSTSGITITKTQYDALADSGATSIKITAYIVLPLSLKLNSDVTIDDLLSAFGSSSSSSDLFSRSEATSTEDLEDYLSVIKSFALDYNLTLPVNGLDATISLEDTTSGISKALSLSGSSLSFTTDEITSILSTYPFEPTISMTLSATDSTGEFTVLRDTTADVSAVVDIQTDGSITLFGQEAN